jgi:hypothetical protein
MTLMMGTGEIFMTSDAECIWLQDGLSLPWEQIQCDSGVIMAIRLVTTHA